jgi:hypothetical protein
VRKKVNKAGGTIGKIFGQEKNIATYNLARMNMLLYGVKDLEFDIFHGDTLLNEWDMRRIDLAATHAQLQEIGNAIQTATEKHNKFLKELGLSSLPSV